MKRSPHEFDDVHFTNINLQAKATVIKISSLMYIVFRASASVLEQKK